MLKKIKRVLFIIYAIVVIYCCIQSSVLGGLVMGAIIAIITAPVLLIAKMINKLCKESAEANGSKWID